MRVSVVPNLDNRRDLPTHLQTSIEEDLRSSIILLGGSGNIHSSLRGKIHNLVLNVRPTIPPIA